MLKRKEKWDKSKVKGRAVHHIIWSIFIRYMIIITISFSSDNRKSSGPAKTNSGSRSWTTLSLRVGKGKGKGIENLEFSYT